MRGQIISRGKGTFLLRVSTGRDTTGQRRTFNETFHGNKKAAETRLTTILNQRDSGTFVAPTSTTLDQYLDRWLKDAAQGSLRPRTYENYKDILVRYIRPQMGPVKLSKLTPLGIQGAYNKMRADGLSARTVRYAHAVLRSSLSQAVKWQILYRNPADFVDLPRNEKKEMQAFTVEQVGEFLKAAETSGTCACNPKRRKAAKDEKHELKPCRYAALFSLAITSGLRPGEYLGLQWPDIDLDRGAVMVRRALVPDGDGGWTFAEPKTKQSFRTVPLPPSVTRAMVEHKRRQAAERLAAGPKYSKQELVFATPTGEALDIRNLVNRHFKKILEAAKLPKTFRLYDLRHSCATLLLAQGEHPKIVSERLGHASITLTLDTYSHVLPTMQQQATERLESVLFSGRGK